MSSDGAEPTIKTGRDRLAKEVGVERLTQKLALVAVTAFYGHLY
jgi:hypothetical protein